MLNFFNAFLNSRDLQRYLFHEYTVAGTVLVVYCTEDCWNVAAPGKMIKKVNFLTGILL